MRLSSQQLALISDSFPALISFVDRECRYRMCNKAYSAWFGLSRNEVLGRTMQEVLGDQVWHQVRSHFDAALAGETREFETEARYRFGGTRWIHAVYTPHKEPSGAVMAVAILVMDITARKEAEAETRRSEERFRAFITASSDAVYRMNADWTEMRELIGRDFVAGTMNPSHNWIGRYLHPDDQPRLVAAIRESIRTKSMFQLETRVIRVDGSLGWTLSRAIPILDANGEISEWFGTAADVTERHRTEQALQASEERYRSLFDSIDEGFCVIEVIFDGDERPVDYLFIEVNPAFEKQAGMQGAAGKRMLEFVSHIESHWLDNYGRVAITGEPIRFAAEYKSLHRWFDVYAFRVGPPANRRVAVLFNNITARKKSEDALRESEERFRNMADHSPMMLWTTDAAGQCTHLNQRWYEFTGQTAETGLGLGWLDALHPHDRIRCERAFRDASLRREAFRAEYRLRQRNGSYRWVIDAASPRFSESGAFLGYIGSVIDIQDRKESEDALRMSRERFDIVTEGAHLGFWFCDLPSLELVWDNRVKEHFGVGADEQVTVDTFASRVHPEDRVRIRAAIEQSIADGTKFDMEFRTVQTPANFEKWVRAIGRSFYDGDGRPVRFDGVTLDVTERKAVETALREAKEQAERASRAKDDFLAQLSHELRTPLTPVLMTAAALREDESLPAAVRDQLDMITRNVALEARLIDDLLDLTRITHGKLALRAETCDVHALLRLVVETVGEEAREKRVNIELDLAASDDRLLGDPARLQQVFWNMLRNAVKFTPEGGRVRLRSFNGDADHQHGGNRSLCIEVQDNGIGFTPGAGEILFQPFERGVAANDQRYPGLGLGLAIARAIVDMHQGTIRAESAGPGRGATFTVQLPGATRQPAPPGRTGVAPAPPAEHEPRLRLLLVEDHAPTLQVLERLLTRRGHQVTTAQTVASALDAAENASFDAVISDIGLPDGTGFELMYQLRASHGLCGIALSGYGMEEDTRRARAAGFVAHLVKPVELKEVRRALRQLTTMR